MYKGLVKIGYPAGEPPDQKAPQLCTIFSQPRKPEFVNLYAVGVYQGIGSGVENNPPHLADFGSVPGETIYAPNHGYDIGDGLGYLVVYADNDSIALHVGDSDGTIDGYAVHFMNLDVNPELVRLYQANSGGREQLPAVGKHQAIGTSRGGVVTVVIRDTGSFMDPRSALDWYSNCELDLGTIVPTDGLGGGGSGNRDKIIYPPLGSLQECPVEYPTVGTISFPTQKTIEPVNLPKDFYCGITPIGEPPICKNPPRDGQPGRDDFCQGTSLMRWCRQETGSCKLIQDMGAACDASGKNIQNCSTFYKFCTEKDVQGFWLSRLNLAHASPQGCSLLNDQDKDTIGRCLDYLKINTGGGSGNPAPPPGTFPSLPVCVPTASKTQAGRCTSACGDKLTITESLGFNIANNCATGTCRATIKIDPTTTLYAPLAKNLADYFAGSLDAGSVAEGAITQEQLTHIQQVLAAGPVTSDDYATLADGFKRAGVARKLLPLEVQDQLKCQFVKYVKNKIDSKLNTKYKYLVDEKETYFQIDGVSIKDFVLPPYFDPDFKKYDPADINIGCSVLPSMDPLKVPGWLGSPSGLAWIDVPLFDNDEAQGKIEFVSGGMFTNELSPIQTSIPEIRRLNSATNIIQKSLMPPETALPPDERQEAITPQSRFLTIGPEIRPNLILNACTKTQTLEEIYKAYDDNPKNPRYVLEANIPSFTLGVECLQNGGNLPKDPASLSKVCSVGPEGQMNCFQQLPADQVPANGRKDFPNVSVQTRNVTPYLFDTYLQTIDQARGVLRIFKPYAIAAAGDNKTDQFRASEEFERNFLPIPAESNKIKYLLNSSTGVTLKEEEGWKLLFDKLGGIWTAKEFVLELLKPVK